MRVRNIPGAKALLKNYVHYIENPKEYKENWKKFFCNTNPIEVEIGMGKGQFITTLAKNNPNINYIGIEKIEELLLKCLRGLDELEEKQPNIVLIHLNALNLKEIFGKGEIQKIYLNFSDPWPKERHKKRRLTHGNFLDVYRELLHKEGEIQLKTDSLALFEFSLEEMRSKKLELKEVIYDLYADARNHKEVMTEYEEKFRKEGKPIYKCIARVKE